MTTLGSSSPGFKLLKPFVVPYSEPEHTTQRDNRGHKHSPLTTTPGLFIRTLPPGEAKPKRGLADLYGVWRGVNFNREDFEAAEWWPADEELGGNQVRC